MGHIIITYLLFLSTHFTAAETNHTEYGYIFHESSGQNEFLIRENDTIPIRFSPSSEKLALNSLQRLKWNVLYLNGSGEEIKLLGKVDKKKQKDGETYFEFILEHWYILTPFYKYADQDGLELPEKMKSDQLTKEDFKNFEGKDEFDVKLFQRKTVK
jgi:hypothetical protein